jgi:hypothetical protein
MLYGLLPRARIIFQALSALLFHETTPYPFKFQGVGLIVSLLAVMCADAVPRPILIGREFLFPLVMVSV